MSFSQSEYKRKSDISIKHSPYKPIYKHRTFTFLFLSTKDKRNALHIVPPTAPHTLLTVITNTKKRKLSLSLQLSLFLSLFLSFLTENHENGSTTTFTTTTTTTTTWLSFAECLAVRGRPGPTSHRVRPCQGVQHSGAHCLRSSLP